MSCEVASSTYNNLSFKEMDEKQAREHFEWYVSQIPLKIELLEEIAASDGVKTRLFSILHQSL